MVNISEDIRSYLRGGIDVAAYKIQSAHGVSKLESQIIMGNWLIQQAKSLGAKAITLTDIVSTEKAAKKLGSSPEEIFKTLKQLANEKKET